MKLVVGLGNPGRQYAGTRHNIGYMVVDALSRKLGWTSGAGDYDRLARTKFDGLAMYGQVTRAGVDEKLLLLKPTTYMNLSGQSVQAATAFYQLTPAELLVVLDDMALPAGRLRLRSGGSHGGHNGLRDIQRALGTDQYPRLRVGIDAPGAGAHRDYVLGPIAGEQRKLIEQAIDRAVECVQAWIGRGVEAAMNEFNASEKSDERKKSTDARRHDGTEGK